MFSENILAVHRRNIQNFLLPGAAQHLPVSALAWRGPEQPEDSSGLSGTRSFKDHRTGFDLRPRLTFQDAHSKEMAIEKFHHGVLGSLSLTGRKAEAEREQLLALPCYLHASSTCTLTSPPQPASGRRPPASPAACG